jgi:polyferredoxin
MNLVNSSLNIKNFYNFYMKKNLINKRNKKKNIQKKIIVIGISVAVIGLIVYGISSQKFFYEGNIFAN